MVLDKSAFIAGQDPRTRSEPEPLDRRKGENREEVTLEGPNEPFHAGFSLRPPSKAYPTAGSFRGFPNTSQEGLCRQERSNAKRVSYKCDVAWQESGLLRLDQIMDLSTYGVYISTTRPCSRGTIITLRFRIGCVQIETKGEVIHRTEGIAGMGVRFSELDSRAYAAIERVVADYSE